MPEEEKRKRPAGAIESAAEETAQTLEQSSQKMIDDLALQEQERQVAVAKAEQEYNNELSEIQRTYKNRMNEQNAYFSDVIRSANKDVQQAQLDAATDQLADQNAARYTGITELAASVVNLIGVGSHNAVPQQYRQYSQDWMKKADQDAKMHRARIANLRERQRAIQGQYAQLKAGQAREAMALAMNRADAAAKRRQAEIEAHNKFANTVAQLQAENQAKAAAIRQQRAERQDSSNQSWARLQQSKDQFKASMASKGLNADGTPNPKLMEQLRAASEAFGGSGYPKGTIAYPIMDATGKINLAHLQPKEMEGLLEFAQGVILSELGKDDAGDFRGEFMQANDKSDKAAVLTKWMGKSPACEQAIRLIDANYKGQHGQENSILGEMRSGSIKDELKNK